MQNIKQYAPDLWASCQKLITASSEKQRQANYLKLESQPIDTTLIEKIPDLLVVPGEFDWMDIGSFPDVHRTNIQDERGNTLQGKVEVENVSNSLVRNDTDVPLAVIGLDNVAVISTPQGVLVTNKNYAQKVGDISKKFAS